MTAGLDVEDKYRKRYQFVHVFNVIYEFLFDAEYWCGSQSSRDDQQDPHVSSQWVEGLSGDNAVSLIADI